MKKLVAIFFFAGYCLIASTPSILFKENKGQWPDKVLFGSEYLNTRFFINKTGFNYCVFNSEDLSRSFDKRDINSIIHGHNYEVNFEGADLSSFKMKNILSEYYNYFLGNDKSKWASHVKASKFLEFREIYNGIDLSVYSSDIHLKYDLIISPHADPDQIKLNYGFIDGISIRNKQLIIKTSVGEVIEQAPLAYQLINGKKKIVECEYMLNGNSVGFHFPKGYDKDHELVIDPVVLVCSYSGTPVWAYGMACNYDANGNIYTTGYSSMGYATTMGAFQVNSSEPMDFYVSVFNSTGTSKLFSTFLGGNDGEWPLDIHVSPNEITVFGMSYSSDYPRSSTAFDTSYNGKCDLVITKLDLTGSSLIASTYIGGSLDENDDQWWPADNQPSSEMQVDAQGNVYIISNSDSPDFPVTPGAFSTSRSGSSDAVVFKINSALNNMLWSTYLGGSGNEDGLSIRPDGGGGVYVAGTTESTDFPTTAGAYDQTMNSPWAWTTDMFVSHLNNTGTVLLGSTYLGTTTSDDGAMMDVDASNNVYICGHLASTGSGILIATAGTYSTPSANSMYKLDASLNNLIFKTKFGGIGANQPHFYFTAIQVDSCGNIYLAGWAWNGQQLTPNRFMPFQGGGSDAYMCVFGPNCSSLKFASYYGSSEQSPTNIAGVGEITWGKSHFDERGVLYMAMAAVDKLPTTPGAYSAFNDTTSAPRIWNDAFIKIDFGTYVNPGSSYGNNIVACPAPFTGNFINLSNTGTAYWDFGDGNTSTLDTISHTYSSLGTYTIMLVVTDTATCNRTDSVQSVLNLIGPTEFSFGNAIYICPQSSLTLVAPVTATSYLWNTGETTPNIKVNEPGTYSLTILNAGGCYSGDEVNVELTDSKLEAFPNVITPNADGANDLIDLSKYQFSEIEFIVYDRWGKEQFKTVDPHKKWEPTDLNNGTYYYIINYFSECTNKHATRKGFITLFK